MLNTQFSWKFASSILLVATLCVGIAAWSFATKLRAGSVAFGSRISSKTSAKRNVPDQLSPSLLAAHDRYVKAFVNSEGFGVSRLPQLDDPFRKPIKLAGHDYLIRRLELVSIQLHDVPVAYINEFSNPLKGSYKQHPTRSLTEFEQESLESLRAGKEFAFNGDDRNPHCVGAIRAQKMCLDCHDSKIGDLLGAFAYELQSGSALPSNTLDRT